MTEQEKLKIKAMGFIPLEIEGKVIALQPKEESLNKLAETYKLGIGTDKDNNYYLLGLEGNNIKVYYRISSDFSVYSESPGWKDVGPEMINLDLSNFDTSNVTSMNHMFNDCIKLRFLDLSNWDTSNVTDMNFMFFNCHRLETLDLSNFDTSKVIHMSRMFEMCTRLESLNVSSFDTSRVEDMMAMFGACESLEFLDLSSFVIDNVKHIDGMFYDCENLKTVVNYDKHCRIPRELRQYSPKAEIVEPTQKTDGNTGAVSECHIFS